MKFILSLLSFSFTFGFSQWNLISPPVGLDYSYTAVCFLNKDTGFVTGYFQYNGAILRTKNGGNTWDTTMTIDLNGTYNELPYAISFPSINRGYVIGGGNIYRTDNCGESWIVVDTTNIHTGIGGGSGPDIIFVNNDTGFCGYADGGAACSRTYDGGWTWTPDPVLPAIRNFNSYNGNYFASTSGWAYLDQTTTTWQSFDNNITSYYHYVNTIIFNGRVIVIGDKMGGTSDGVYAYSDDMGATWVVQYVDPGRLKGITFLNDTLWQMCGNLNGSLRTYDAGSTWHYTSIENFGTGMSKWFRDFYFINDSVGFAVSQNGIYKTTNCGGMSSGDATFYEPDLSATSIVPANQIQLYPNPFHDRLNILNGASEITEIFIFTVYGKLIFHSKIIDQYSFDTSSIPSGSYIIQLISDENSYTSKLFKE